MKTVLNDRQKLVLDCIFKQYNTKQSLEYLREQGGFDVTERTLQRDKKFIKNNSLLRLYQIAKIDFRAKHQERKEELEFIKREMYRKYNEITDPYKCILALEHIANINPIISAYEDTARYVIEKSDSNTKQDQTISI